jgi:chemotaxis protein CheY-P-specific phosphatase CheC
MSEGSTANDIIMKNNEIEPDNTPQANTMKDTISEMGKTLHEKYKARNSFLSYDNIDGMVEVDVLNEYMEVNFGHKYTVLEKLVNSKCERVISKDGFGIVSLIEFVKSIQATFEQHQLPEGLKGLMNRR